MSLLYSDIVTTVLIYLLMFYFASMIKKFVSSKGDVFPCKTIFPGIRVECFYHEQSLLCYKTYLELCTLKRIILLSIFTFSEHSPASLEHVIYYVTLNITCL